MRLHHSKLLGVKVSDKKETFNLLPTGGPSLLDPPKKKKKKADEDEDSGDGSTDEEG